MNGPPPQEPSASTLSKPLAKAMNLLQHAASSTQNSDALFLLAEINFHGNYSLPRNYGAAFEKYQQLAAATGNSTAQHMIGFMYATGIGGAVQRDQAKALLYHTFAAEQGDTRAEMTVAFRHHGGIGTPRNCEEAAYFYKRVADKAMIHARSGPPGGPSMPRDSFRWAEDEGGVYGEGASVSSSGPNANKDGNAHASLEDIMEYLDLMSRKGDLKATFSIGKVYYDGNRAIKRNVRLAKRHFLRVAGSYWTKDGKVKSGGPKGIEKTASKAAAYIGRMFLRGEGMEQSFVKAATWFKRGVANGDMFCQYQMGMMYLHGYGVPKDAHKASNYFKAAADQDFPAAESELGVLFLDQGDVPTAVRYFELAARHGWMQAFYYLAEIANQGIGREKHCSMATAYYKIVAEKAEVLHSSFKEANLAYEAGDMETALVDSMMAAEQGYENAQANVAYILDEQKSILPLRRLLSFRKTKGIAPILRNAALALVYWTRSARQANIDSRVKMGDYYLKGIGTEADVDKASTCYQSAADGHHSAQAFWNLGWMHENGIAVEQDFHMAKRFYDLALETNSEAYLPVKLSLIKLRARSYWNTFTHGTVNSIREEPDESKHWRSFSDWMAHFLEYAYEDDMHSGGSNLDDIDLDDATADAAAFNDPGPMPGGDDFYDDFDDGILESLIIIGLAATLAFLVYYRQNRQLQNQGAGNLVVAPAPAPGVGAVVAGAQPVDRVAQDPPEQPIQGDEARGFFPNPGDPEFQDWVVGGVGH